MLRRARPGLFVVDEAHLVSQWGRDFRPDYLRLGAQADALGAAVRMALTATAAPPVRREICRRLGLRDPEVVIGDFDRPQIELSVDACDSPKDKQRQIERSADELAGSGIVYAATHAGAEAARDTLAAAGERVTLYHAGLAAGARREAMTEFLDGSARIVSATVAFGMGIDKPDVRWVLHADAPGSLDAYYQELGRAGRDGDRAEARLLYRPERHRRSAASDGARGSPRPSSPPGVGSRGSRPEARALEARARARRRWRWHAWSTSAPPTGRPTERALERGDGSRSERSPRRASEERSRAARSSALGWR